MLTYGDVEEAAGRISGRVRRTPVVRADEGTWLKLEQLQHSGSFKARGAFNRLLAAGEGAAAGVVAASGGNAGLAVAYAARELGVRAEVFVPETAPAVKVRKLKGLGADVRQVGTIYQEAFDAASKRAAESGALLCHAYDQVEVCAGQGTLGLELLEQLPEIDTVIVAVGGGGLMAGIATAVQGRAKVVAVEPAGVPTLRSALEAGQPVDVEVDSIAADSLGASRIGEIAFDVAVRAGVESVLVDDQAIIAARRHLWDHWRMAVEYGAAAALAALHAGAYVPAPGEKVAVVICGANTDPADLSG